jgi:glycine cleavage system H protein
MSFPTDRKYAETHEWVRVEGRVATMGITQYAADELTDITYVELPSPGTRVDAQSACGEIESVKATSEFFSAVDGKVVEVNNELADHPELVNEDAFGKGWMIKIEIRDASGLDRLMDAAAYEKHIASEA